MPLTNFLTYLSLSLEVNITENDYIVYKGELKDLPVELEENNYLVVFADILDNVLEVEVIEV